MNPATVEKPVVVVVYPESDGKRMAENTKQARWITVLHGNLEALLREQEAFVAMDLLWYAKEGFPEECAAPDVFVAFGRPRGDRRSYLQWEEDDVAPQVVFEVLSPSNTSQELEVKEAFYSEHGVQEYYIYDPEKETLDVYLRQRTVLRRKWVRQDFTSPSLGIRFDLSGPEMQVFYPDGRRFLTFAELDAARAELEAARAKLEAELESARAKLEAESSQLTQRSLTAERLARRLAELGRKARTGQATAEELAELQRLEQQIDALSS